MTNELQLHQISVSEMDNNCYLLQAGEVTLRGGLAQAAGEEGIAYEEIGHAIDACNQGCPALPAEVDVELRDGDSIEFAGLVHERQGGAVQQISPVLRYVG